MGGGHPAGGSAELAGLIEQAGECLLADFQRYYHLDLYDVLRDGSRLSPRRALALIKHLPAESATVAELRGGPQFLGWGPDRYLLAALVDAVQQTTYATVAANAKQKPPAPKPVPRPAARAAPEKQGAGNPFRAQLEAAKSAKRGEAHGHSR